MAFLRSAPGSTEPFAGFEHQDITTSRGTIRAQVGGSGPPVLLLHGYPQTQLMWQAVAPLLAERRCPGHAV